MLFFCRISQIRDFRSFCIQKLNIQMDNTPKITVVIRKRPLGKKELARGDQDIVVVKDAATVILSEIKLKVDLTKYVEQHNFNFDLAFDDGANNEQVYYNAVRPIIEAAFNKARCTCFAYGQTGSGKTYTMLGDHDAQVPGLYLMASYDLFTMLQRPEYSHLYVTISFYEIYCGKLFDLLNERNQLAAQEDAKGNVQIKGLCEKKIQNVQQLMQIIQHGQSARVTSANSANSESSRSHALLQINIKNGKQCHGKLSFIDLAGSERGADVRDQDKATRVDGAEINKSLLALKECIRALDLNKNHTPFRGSKLTLVLKDSLVGNCRTVMIGNISPSSANSEHTLNTLRYADRVKELKKPQDQKTGQDGINRELFLARTGKSTVLEYKNPDSDEEDEAIPQGQQGSLQKLASQPGYSQLQPPPLPNQNQHQLNMQRTHSASHKMNTNTDQNPLSGVMMPSMSQMMQAQAPPKQTPTQKNKAQKSNSQQGPSQTQPAQQSINNQMLPPQMFQYNQLQQPNLQQFIQPQQAQQQPMIPQPQSYQKQIQPTQKGAPGQPILPQQPQQQQYQPQMHQSALQQQQQMAYQAQMNNQQNQLFYQQGIHPGQQQYQQNQQLYGPPQGQNFNINSVNQAQYQSVTPQPQVPPIPFGSLQQQSMNFQQYQQPGQLSAHTDNMLQNDDYDQSGDNLLLDEEEPQLDEREIAIREKQEEIVQQIFEEEESMMLAHKEHIDEMVVSTKNEMILLNTVTENQIQNSDYVAKLKLSLELKHRKIQDLLEKIANYEALIFQESELNQQYQDLKEGKFDQGAEHQFLGNI